MIGALFDRGRRMSWSLGSMLLFRFGLNKRSYRCFMAYIVTSRDACMLKMYFYRTSRRFSLI